MSYELLYINCISFISTKSWNIDVWWCPAVQVRAEAKEALARRAAPGAAPGAVPGAAPGAAPGVAGVAVGAPHGTVQAGLDEATGAAEHSTPSEGARHACDTRGTRVRHASRQLCYVVLVLSYNFTRLYKAVQQLQCNNCSDRRCLRIRVISRSFMSSYVFVCLQTGFRWNWVESHDFDEFFLSFSGVSSRPIFSEVQQLAQLRRRLQDASDFSGLGLLLVAWEKTSRKHYESQKNRVPDVISSYIIIYHPLKIEHCDIMIYDIVVTL